MTAVNKAEMREIFLAHLDRLRASYKTRSSDCRAAYEAADASGDTWTAGLERGLSMAYGMAAEDLAAAVETERKLQRVTA